MQDFRPGLGVLQRGHVTAEMAQRIADRLVGHLLVAFADDDVDGRLATDELRQRRHHDRIAEIGAHADGFLQSRR